MYSLILTRVVADEWANTDAFFVMFSLRNRLSFRECDRWIQTIRTVDQYLRRRVPIVLVGLQSDLENPRVSRREIDALQSLYRIPYVSISSRTSINLYEPFLAVQDILNF